MSNSLDPDQAVCSVRPDLGPKCLQRLSADYTSCTLYMSVMTIVACDVGFDKQKIGA